MQFNMDDADSSYNDESELGHQLKLPAAPQNGISALLRQAAGNALAVAIQVQIEIKIPEQDMMTGQIEHLN